MQILPRSTPRPGALVLAFGLLLGATAAVAMPGNQAPVAEAGLGVMAYVNDTVILNGQGSSDPDGQPLTYAWTQQSGPPVALTGGDTDRPSFVVEAPGTLRFQLIVTDGSLASSPDEVAVVIPDRERRPLGDSGCASAPGGAGWLGVLVGLALLRRAPRR